MHDASVSSTEVSVARGREPNPHGIGVAIQRQKSQLPTPPIHLFAGSCLVPTYFISPIRHAEHRGTVPRWNSDRLAGRSQPQSLHRANFGRGLDFLLFMVNSLRRASWWDGLRVVKWARPDNSSAAAVGLVGPRELKSGKARESGLR
jgi:hypothetical protein